MWKHGGVGLDPGSRGMNVRKLLVITGIAMLGAFLVGGTSIAGAQTPPTTTTTIPFTCDFTTTPATLGPAGGTVSVSGTAPANTDVHVTVQNATEGTQTKTVTSDSTTGNWGPVDFNITSTASVTVTLAPFYPATTCVGPAEVAVEAANAAQTQALPRTGSNDTKPFVLVGAAAVLVGLVLVVASRRRNNARGRV